MDERLIMADTRIPLSYSLSDDEMVLAVGQNIEVGKNALGDWVAETEESNAFYAGHQWADEDAELLRANLRPVITFNRAKPFIDAIVGFFIQNRREVEYNPVGEEDLSTSDLANDAVRWMRLKGWARDAERGAMKDLLLGGVGCVNKYFDDESDPQGIVKYEHVPSIEMLWDPTARGKNLHDARWVCRIKHLSEEEIVALFGREKFEKIKEAAAINNGLPTNVDDARDYFAPGNKTVKDSDNQLKPYMVAECQWYQVETYYRVSNPLFDGEFLNSLKMQAAEQALMGGAPDINSLPQMVALAAMADDLEFSLEDEDFVVKSDSHNTVKELFATVGIPLKEQKAKHRRYYKAFCSKHTLLEKSENITHRDFSYQFVTGDYDERDRRYYGVMRQLKDPARYANKAFSQLLHAINSLPKGGLIVEEDATDDLQELEASYARDDSVVTVAKGAIAEGRVMPKAQAQIPTGYELILEISKMAMPESTGINQEMLGMGTEEASGILEKQRVLRSSAILAEYFDAMAMFYQRQGYVEIELLRMLVELYPGRMIRVMGRDGAVSFQKLVIDRLSECYDLEVADAPAAPNERQETFEHMMQLLQTLGPTNPTLANAFSRIALENAPVSEKVLREILQGLEASQQPDPAAMKEQQEMSELNKRLFSAEALMKEAQAQESIADVAYKRAQAIKALAEAKKTGIENTANESLMGRINMLQ